MLNQLMKIFNIPKSSNPVLDKDAVAGLLCVSPEALAAFEEAYKVHALSQESNDFFAVNSRQAAAEKHAIEAPIHSTPEAALDASKDLEMRIVDELLSQTATYAYDGKNVMCRNQVTLPGGCGPVENSDINALPEELRPQLSGNLMKVDICEPSYPHLLWFYERSKTAKTPRGRQEAYHRFRQGLDILDLDPVTYEIIGTNPNSMGFWFPKLVDACRDLDFFKVPATTIAKVPLSLLQLTRQEYRELTQVTLNIVDRWASRAFGLDPNKEYFIKTGTYSSKFDFRNAHVHGADEVRELGEYLLFIHYQALQMASPLCTPCIYGVSTTNEWVVREFIPDKENNPCIYKGLPLHTEYRVFVDCDTDAVIGIAPYWEPETMKQRFGHESDADSPHQIHDYIIYKAHEETLMRRYNENKDAVAANIESLLPYLDLQGQWSIDIMQNGDGFWIIDMALAENSAFYNYVPEHLRSPSPENWIPQLPDERKE